MNIIFVLDYKHSLKFYNFILFHYLMAAITTINNTHYTI